MNSISNLTFNVIRSANQQRLPHFKNAKGFFFEHDWSLNDWMTAVAGEVGEAANICKKIRRGDFTLVEARPALARELADIVCYLDFVAKEAGIDLGHAVEMKFNEVSLRVGSPVRIDGIDNKVFMANME